ncbi:MAG: YEATS-associated helix-containing protein [Pseudohongiellaceae bacterium]
MTGHFSTLVFIMLLVGSAGGVINYYTLNTRSLPDRSVLLRCIMLGVLVTFLVPFMLSVFGSNLVVESEGNSAKLLNYVAICLAVAILPRFFMTGLAENVLNEARASSDKVDLLQYQLKQLQEEMLPLIDTETEDDNLALGVDEQVVEPAELDVASTKVLKALGCGRFIYRSLEGLCREAETDETTMAKTLSFLTLKSLAGKVSGRKGVRWYITEKGRQLIDVGA